MIAGRRVLLTGDSHMEWSPFGRLLAAKLRRAGAVPVNFAIGGSTARAWASGSPVCHDARCVTIADLRASRPDVAIISLGTNDGANADAAGGDQVAAARQAAEQLLAFTRRVGAPVTWIVGPPSMAGRGHYTDAAMAPVVAAFASAFPGRFIDSRSVPRLDGDGVHMGPRSGEIWAQLVFDEVARPAIGPIGFVVGAIVIAGLVKFIRRRRRVMVEEEG